MAQGPPDADEKHVRDLFAVFIAVHHEVLAGGGTPTDNSFDAALLKMYTLLTELGKRLRVHPPGTFLLPTSVLPLPAPSSAPRPTSVLHLPVPSITGLVVPPGPAWPWHSPTVRGPSWRSPTVRGRSATQAMARALAVALTNPAHNSMVARGAQQQALDVGREAVARCEGDTTLTSTAPGALPDLALLCPYQYVDGAVVRQERVKDSEEVKVFFAHQQPHSVVVVVSVCTPIEAQFAVVDPVSRTVTLSRRTARAAQDLEKLEAVVSGEPRFLSVWRCPSGVRPLVWSPEWTTVEWAGAAFQHDVEPLLQLANFPGSERASMAAAADDDKVLGLKGWHPARASRTAGRATTTFIVDTVCRAKRVSATRYFNVNDLKVHNLLNLAGRFVRWRLSQDGPVYLEARSDETTDFLHELLMDPRVNPFTVDHWLRPEPVRGDPFAAWTTKGLWDRLVWCPAVSKYLNDKVIKAARDAQNEAESELEVWSGRSATLLSAYVLDFDLGGRTNVVRFRLRPRDEVGRNVVQNSMHWPWGVRLRAECPYGPDAQMMNVDFWGRVVAANDKENSVVVEINHPSYGFDVLTVKHRTVELSPGAPDAAFWELIDITGNEMRDEAFGVIEALAGACAATAVRAAILDEGDLDHAIDDVKLEDPLHTALRNGLSGDERLVRLVLPPGSSLMQLVSSLAGVSASLAGVSASLVPGWMFGGRPRCEEHARMFAEQEEQAEFEHLPQRPAETIGHLHPSADFDHPVPVRPLLRICPSPAYGTFGRDDLAFLWSVVPHIVGMPVVGQVVLVITGNDLIADVLARQLLNCGGSVLLVGPTVSDAHPCGLTRLMAASAASDPVVNRASVNLRRARAKCKWPPTRKNKFQWLRASNLRTRRRNQRAVLFSSHEERVLARLRVVVAPRPSQWIADHVDVPLALVFLAPACKSPSFLAAGVAAHVHGPRTRVFFASNDDFPLSGLCRELAWAAPAHRDVVVVARDDYVVDLAGVGPRAKKLADDLAGPMVFVATPLVGHVIAPHFPLELSDRLVSFDALGSLLCVGVKALVVFVTEENPMEQPDEDLVRQVVQEKIVVVRVVS